MVLQDQRSCSTTAGSPSPARANNFAKSRTSRKAERDEVLTQVRNELRDILTLLQTENLKWTTSGRSAAW